MPRLVSDASKSIPSVGWSPHQAHGPLKKMDTLYGEDEDDDTNEQNEK
jgi:hypothetical protein